MDIYHAEPGGRSRRALRRRQQHYDVPQHSSLCREPGMGAQRCHGCGVHGNNSNLRCAGRSNLYFPIYHPLVPVIRGVGAIWRPYHDAKCDGVLSKAILRTNESGKHTPVPAAGLGGTESPIGRRNDGLRGLGGA